MQEGNRSVHVNSVTISKETSEMILNDASMMLAFYDDWFSGDVPKEISIIQSPREKGGGYARRGLVVLGGLQDQQYVELREAYCRYLGHEIAHFWWWKAETSSWEDWLNESFAEYSALMVVRELFGESAFEKRMLDKQNAINHTVPIWGFERTDISTEAQRKEVETVLYNKGPVLLFELEKKIGDEKFKALCRQMVSSKVTSTPQFLQMLSEFECDEVSNWMEKSLKER
jgi:hypothetical protein